MRLIPEWRRAWRMLSVQAASLILVWVALPVETQTAILVWSGVRTESITAALGLLVILGRLVDQPKVRE